MISATGWLPARRPDDVLGAVREAAAQAQRGLFDEPIDRSWVAPGAFSDLSGEGSLVSQHAHSAGPCLGGLGRSTGATARRSSTATGALPTTAERGGERGCGVQSCGTKPCARFRRIVCKTRRGAPAIGAPAPRGGCRESPTKRCSRNTPRHVHETPVTQSCAGVSGCRRCLAVVLCHLAMRCRFTITAMAGLNPAGATTTTAGGALCHVG